MLAIRSVEGENGKQWGLWLTLMNRGKERERERCQVEELGVLTQDPSSGLPLRRIESSQYG